MAQQKVILEVVVSDNGTTKIVTKGIDNLGQSADRTGKKIKGAADAQNELNYKLNQGTTGVSSAAKSFSKLNQAIGTGPNGLVGAYATLAANAFAVSAAFTTLKNAAQVEQLLKGLEAQGAATGRTLTTVAQSVRELSGASLSAGEAMRAVAQAGSSNIKTSDIERLTSVATASARALGRDVPDSLNRLILAVTKAEPELVDELGLTIKLNEAMEMYARQTGKTASSLSRLEKQQALINAWATQGEAKFGALASSVDPNPYDQLAATFSDLTTTFLNFLNNSGLLALTAFFAQNKLALTAAILAFVSTIRKQLLPGIVDAAKQAKNFAQEQVTALKQQQIELSKIEKSTLKNQKANDKLFQNLSNIKSTSKAYREWAEAEAKGVATTEQHAKALKTLEDSEKRYQNLKNKAITAGDTTKTDTYTQNAEQRAKDIQNFKSYEANKEKIANKLSQSQAAQSALAIEVKAQEAAISAQTARADAIEALSKGQLKRAYSELIISSVAYREQLTQQIILKAELAGVTNAAAAAETNLARASILARTGLFAIATGVKAVGSAVLTAMPYVALIVMGLQVLSEVADFFIPESWKKASEAFDKFGEIIDSTKQKFEAYTAIQNKEGEISTKATALLQNRINTLAELGDSYLEYSTTITTLEQDQLSATEQSKRSFNGLLAIFGNPVALATVAWNHFADATNRELGIPLGSLTHDIFQISPASSDADKATAAFMANLEKALPNTVKGFYELNNNFKGVNAEARNQSVRDWATRIQPAMEQARAATDDLIRSVDELKNAYTDYNKSLQATTPYDTLVSKINSVISSSSSLGSALRNSLLNEDDVKTMMDEVGKAQSSLPFNIMTEAAQNSYTTLQNIDNALSSLRTQLGTLEQGSTQYKATQEQINRLVAEQSREAENLRDTLNSNLSSEQKYYHTLQLQSIQLQAKQKLAQAYLGVLQRQGVISVQDLNRQIDAQNNIINLEAKALEANQRALDQQVTQKQLELDRAVQRKQEILDLIEIGKQERDNYKTRLDGYKMSILMQEALHGQTSATIAATVEANRLLALVADTTDESMQRQLEAQQRIVDAAQQALDIAKANAQANKDAVAAIRMGATDSIERAYQNAKLTLDILKEINSLNAQINSAKITQYTQERRLLDIQSNGIGSKTREIEILKEEFRLRRENEAAEANSRLSELTIERDKAVAQNRTGAVKVLDERISRLNTIRALQIVNTNNEELINRLGIIDLDTKEKKLNLLKEIVDFSLKEVESQASLLEKEQQLANLRRRNANGGRELSATAQKAQDYANLQRQVQLARQNLEIRKLGIEMEYALLAAQKELLLDQLRARRAEANILASDTTKSQEVRDAAEQSSTILGTAIDNLAGRSYEALRQNAIRIAEMDVSILEEQAKLAYNEIISGFLDEVLGRNNPAKKMLDSINDSATILEQIKAGKSAEQATAEAKLDNSTRATVSATDRTTTAVNSTTAAINSLHDTVRRIVEQPTGATGAQTPNPEGTGSSPDPDTITTALSSLIRLPAFRSAFSRSSGFGRRERPIEGASTNHAGQDFRYPEGTDLTSQLPGVVRFSGAMGGFGNVVDVYVGELENGTKVFRRFAHMMDTAVTAGQRVDTGTLLGRTGNTGTSTGPHLHQGTYMEDSRGRTTAMSPEWQPMVHPYGASGANDNEIVVTAQQSKAAIKSIADGWSESIKMAREEVAAGGESIQLSFIESLAAVSPVMAQMNEQLRTLGPEGELVASINEGMQTISVAITTIVDSLTKGFAQGYTEYVEGIRTQVEETGELNSEALANLQTQGEFTAGRLAVAFSAAAAAIGAVNQILAAASQAKIANIDKEIAAEQKRDGKSAASMAKLDAMEKKKDAIARKQFNTNKKLMMAQAVMSTAAGIAGVLAHSFEYGPVLTPILAGMIGAMGLAQIAIIAGSQYESSYSPSSIQTPSSLAVGKRSDSVNLAMGPNANAGGELAYIRGSQGTGSNASNYNAIGSAYGGPMQRGYGNRGFVVGEKGPEVITPETPITVTPANENNGSAPVNATINIQAIDSQGVQDVLVAQKGNIIQMLRQAANASGQRFLEDVNVNVYTRPNVGKLL